MAAVTPKVFEFVLTQTTTPVAVRHFQANPCIWRCLLPEGEDFRDALRVTGEIHPLEGSATPLAASSVEDPGAVDSVDIEFSAAQCNQAVPRGTRTLWLVITAVYPDDDVRTFLVGQMLLVKHHFSGVTPPAPAPALYASQEDLDALADEVAALEGGGGGGGVTDHGALTGLADDDHPQYHNNTRGDARYASLSAMASETSAREALAVSLASAQGNISAAQNDILALQSEKAPLASPALTGNPTAPTQSPGNDSTRLATTAFVQAAISVLLGSPVETLDTLAELASALGSDPNFATTVAANIAAKLAKASNLADLTDASAALTNLGLTANGKSLVTAANFAAMRTLLALAAGDVTGLSGTVADDIQALAEADNGLEALINARLVAANNLSDLTNAATARGSLGLGTAATGTIGTTAGNVVALDGAAKLPAVDGSQLTNLPGGATRVKLTSAFTTTSGSAQVTGLKFTVGANKNYHVRGVLKIKTDTATVAPRLGINWPTGTTAPVAKIEEPATSSTNVMRYWGPTSTTANQNTGLPDATNFYYAEVVAVFSTDGTGAGDFEITLQSETAGTSVHLGADSFLKYSDY